MKKNILFILFLLFISFTSFAQEVNEPKPAYLKNPTLPVINILNKDSVLFTNEDIPKGNKVAIIYFSPDCSHCQYEAKEIVKNMDSFKNVFFVWINYHHSLKEINEFSVKYNLSKYSNVIVGKETSYKIAVFYQIEFTPYMAIYNSRGIFKKEFRTGAKPEELIEALK